MVKKRAESQKKRTISHRKSRTKLVRHKHRKTSKAKRKPAKKQKKSPYSNKKLKELEGYIRQSLRKGISKETVVKTLLDVGWPEKIVKKHFDKVVKNLKNKEIEKKELSEPTKEKPKKRFFERFKKKEKTEKNNIKIKKKPKTTKLKTYKKARKENILSRVLKSLPEPKSTKEKPTKEEKELGKKSIFSNLFKVFSKKKGKERRAHVDRKLKLKIERKVKMTPIIIEIRNSLRNKNRLETDLDKLYNILQKRKKIKLSEISVGFNITKKQAEEWCIILETNDLAVLHYPTFGEPELKCK